MEHFDQKKEVYSPNSLWIFSFPSKRFQKLKFGPRLRLFWNISQYTSRNVRLAFFVENKKHSDMKIWQSFLIIQRKKHSDIKFEIPSQFWLFEKIFYLLWRAEKTAQKLEWPCKPPLNKAFICFVCLCLGSYWLVAPKSLLLSLIYWRVGTKAISWL